MMELSLSLACLVDADLEPTKVLDLLVSGTLKEPMPLFLEKLETWKKNFSDFPKGLNGNLIVLLR